MPRYNPRSAPESMWSEPYFFGKACPEHHEGYAAALSINRVPPSNAQRLSLSVSAHCINVHRFALPYQP